MSSTCVTRHVEFEMAHLLNNYKGGCGNLHGHTYKLEVTVCADTSESEYGFVIDFKKLDAIIRAIVPDHKFVANGINVHGSEQATVEGDICKVLDKYGLEYELYPFATSAENMVGYFAKAVNDELQACHIDAEVVECKLWETTNSYATWHK